MADYVELMRPVAHDLDERGIHDVIFFGGLGSAALGEEATLILPEERRIVTPDDFHVGLIRDNGSRKDVDALKWRTDPMAIKDTEVFLKGHLGKQLRISVFGVHDVARIRRHATDPTSLSAMRMVLSDRFGTGPDGNFDQVEKAITPFSVVMHPDTLHTWALDIGEGAGLAIPHPGAMILNYLTRSISGVRPKDNERKNDEQFGKLDKLVIKLFSDMPDLKEWVIDGPGKSQFELARILHTLREPIFMPRPLVIGDSEDQNRQIELRPMTLPEIAEHDAFMLRDKEAELKNKALVQALLKSQGLHITESDPRIVKAFQEYLEPAANRLFIMNR